jgi:predicted O-methyltransferase YrrM
MVDGSESSILPLVTRALELAEKLSFVRSCSPETGRLLRVLAAQVRDGVIAEIGTGCGVGAAWMVTGLRPGTSFVTVEIEETLARAPADLLASVPEARVISGDWREILPYGPFALLFADAAAAKQHESEALLAALRLGGLIVLDDLAPGQQTDPLRAFWLTDRRVAASEVLVSAAEAVILATRIE